LCKVRDEGCIRHWPQFTTGTLVTSEVLLAYPRIPHEACKGSKYWLFVLRRILERQTRSPAYELTGSAASLQEIAEEGKRSFRKGGQRLWVGTPHLHQGTNRERAAGGHETRQTSISEVESTIYGSLRRLTEPLTQHHTPQSLSRILFYASFWCEQP
jgi:hypothetical protein